MKMHKRIPVCSDCLQASCWQGIFMCDNSKNAGVVYRTKRELRKLKREHPSYWNTDKQLFAE